MSQRRIKQSSQSRHQLVEWISRILSIELNSIEQLGSGAVFCQLLNIAHTNSVPQHRINFAAKNQYEFLNNFRLLQDAFAKLGIDQPIDPAKLARAKYQDNFELALWFNGYLGKEKDVDCTMNSSIKAQQYDFSFDNQEVVPKHGSSHSCISDATCSVCLAKAQRSQRKTKKRIRELTVKMQMISEVLLSKQSPDEMIFLIQQIIDLQQF